ncbi:MAG: peptidylprolyl isomerase [Anaerolineae bacterium]|nr:peptidylprolyl isomerase [Anaerolineae bacterium]
MKISDGKAVQIDYTLTNDAGKVLDTSEGRQPLAYLHGAGNIIPGLEKALAGKEAGDTLSVSIPPAEGYGERSEAMVMTADLAQFPNPQQVQVGARFHVQTDKGVHLATVTEVTAAKAVLDLNHPLAGETLHFDVEVVGVKEATEEERSHGHVHTGHEHGHT